MQTTQTWPIVLNLIAAIFGALGQWLYKNGSGRIGQIAMYKNWQMFLGMGLFCIVMLLFVFAFKLGGKLSVTYPIYATTFIWGTLLAVWADHEPWSWLQITGIGFVVIGVSFVAIFAPKT